MKLMAMASLVAVAALPLMAQSEKDRAEIEDLMWRYTRALDTHDSAAYIAVFTPDGEFRSGGAATKGHEALKKMVDGLKANAEATKAKGQTPAPMYHMEMNHRITFLDKDHVRYEAYWQTVFGAVGRDTPVRVAAAGREVDEIVRVNGKWLIKVRDVAPKD